MSPLRRSRQSRFRWGRPTLVGVAAATLVAGLSQLEGVSATGRAAPAVVLSAADLPVGAPAAVPFGTKRLGPAPRAARLQFDVVLDPRDPAALARFATEVSTLGTPEYGHFLPRGRFASVFGPTRATITRVLAVLHEDGFTTGAISSNHLVIPVSTTVGDAERALHTPLERYRMPSGRLATANTEAPRLPATVAGAVQAVIGLDTLVLPQPGGPVRAPAHSRRLHVRVPAATGPGPVACAAAATAAAQEGSYTENQLAKAYSLNGLYERDDFGNGVTIALFELTTYKASDIAGFQRCYGTDTPIKNVPVFGGTTSNAGEGEAELDIEVVLGLAPLAHLLVYEAKNGGTGTINEYTSIVDQDRAQVMSSSWGVCEAFLGASAAKAENTIFQQAAAQGQSMVSIPGDEGSEGCLPNDFGVLGTGLGTNAVPNGLAIDPSTSTAFIADNGNGKVSVVGDLSLGTVATFSFGPNTRPYDVAIDPTTHNVFVTLKAADELVEIDGATCNADVAHPSCTERVLSLADVHYPGGSFPEGVAVDSGTGTVYVALSDFGGAIAVISEASFTALGTVPGGNDPDGVAVDDNTHEVFFTATQSDAVGGFDGATCNATNQSDCPTTASGVSVGLDPTNVAVDPALNRIYVSNTESNTVTILTASSGQVVGTIHLSPVVNEPVGLAIGPGGTSLLVACAAKGSSGRAGVAVVSLTTHAVTSVLAAGSEPVAVAVDPETAFAATSDAGDSALIVSPLLLDPWDPGTQPFVTGVGGTDLTRIGPKPTESVWNQHLNPRALTPEGAGGGGISFDFLMPKYQSGPGVINRDSSGAPCGLRIGRCREVPDVSASADPTHGYIVFEQGQWEGVGGTSAAAPLWAAVIGLLDVQQGSLHKLGFVNPALYKLAAEHKPIVNDVTVGNDDYTTTGGGLYPATRGYDMATGLGTPIGTGLSRYLGYEPVPTIRSVSPNKGPRGTIVTIRGTGLLWASSLKFGPRTAIFVVVSGTEIQALATGGTGTVTVTVTTPGGKSRASRGSRFTHTTH
jgi:DNA-binding beta-propeller fold protein YncE